MRIKSIKSSVTLLITIIAVLSVFSAIGIYQGKIVSETERRYHQILRLERDLADIIVLEETAGRHAGEYSGVLEAHGVLQQKTLELAEPAIHALLVQRQKSFATLFSSSDEISRQHQAVRQLLPGMINSVRYIHEHHLAYMNNLMRRGRNTQDWDINKDFQRSPVKSAPEGTIISAAVAIQNRLLDVFAFFYKMQTSVHPAALTGEFQRTLEQFYKAVNTFEDYSLDAQDGLLVEELLLNGRNFEKAFTRLLASEAAVQKETGRLDANYAALSKGFAVLRQDIEAQNSRTGQTLAAIQYGTALTFMLLLVWLFYYGRHLLSSFRRTVRETKTIQTDLEYDIPVESGDYEEFRIVFRALNDMAHTIREQIRELEQVHGDLERKIAERTLELKETNQRLIREIEERTQGEKERITLERKLNRAGKMQAIGTLAGGVAHDLNNVLSGIVSYPDLILNDMPVDHRLRPAIMTIKSSGAKAAAIVQDLLTLARRGTTVEEVVDLPAMVEEFIHSPELAHIQSRYPLVQVKTRLMQDPGAVKGSSIHLQKTLMNLTVNAFEAIPESGTVTLSAESVYIDTALKGYDDVREGEYVKLCVSDTGTGITPEDQDRIFEPFFSTKKMGQSGTGLGMAVVWGTVKDHGGYIDIQSREGIGTTFNLYFPMLRRDQLTLKTPKVLPQCRGSGERILVVDDIAEQRHIAVQMLRRLNYTPMAVDSGEAAVSFVREKDVDLLLLDMIMPPGIDGLETFKRILPIRPGIKAVIASGFSETDRVKEAQRLGAGAYLRKPYTLEKLGQTVHDELQN